MGFCGFLVKKTVFWVILGVLEVIFWSTSAVYPSWSGEEVIWGLFLGPFWVIWESPLCKDPPETVNWVELKGLRGRFPGAGIYGVSGMGFFMDFWVFFVFFWVFLSFWAFFVVQNDRRDELAGW
jgi:hypothetical protein